MQTLKLTDFEYGMMDHWFHYDEDISLEPAQGGFFIHYKQNLVTASPVSESEALEMIQDFLEEKKRLIEEKERWEADTEVEYQQNSQEE